MYTRKISLSGGGDYTSFRSREEEDFLLLWNALRKYFRRAYHHGPVNRPVEDCTLYVYAECREDLPFYEKERIVLDWTYPVQDAREAYAFDWFRGFYCSETPEHSHTVITVWAPITWVRGSNEFDDLVAIQIRKRKRKPLTLIGVYSPELKSLWLCDISHSRSVLESFLKDALPQLVEKLGLKPLSSSERYRPVYDGPVTLGGDPEFEVINLDGDFVPAHEVISDPDRDSPVGLDGASSTGELRPDPSPTPEGLVENLRQCLKALTEDYLLEGYVFSLKGKHVPLGGHVHFGFEEELSEQIIRRLCQALDDFVGIPLRGTNGSARGSYDRLGAYELKRWGFEYRTPPATYLAHPEWARLVYKVAQGVVKTLLKEGYLEYELEGGIPSKEAYLKIGLTEEEHQLFFQFIRSYRSLIKPPQVYKAWELTMPEKRARVVTRDDWDRLLSQSVRDVLWDVLDLDAKVYLYGLRSDRGFVASLPGSPYDFEGYPKPLRAEDGSLWIGLPYTFRMREAFWQEVEPLLEELVAFLNREGYLRTAPEEALRKLSEKLRPLFREA